MNSINSIRQSIYTRHRLRALWFVSWDLQQQPCSACEERPGQQVWIWVTREQRCIHSSTAFSSKFHGGYAASSGLDLSREETGVNQLAVDIVETPG